MGIVIKHSAWNFGITGAGLLLGAVNVLLLATTYLDDEYYGLWGYVLSMAFLLFPLMSFGIHNTIVKNFAHFKTKKEKDTFLTQMLFWPLLIIIPFFVLLYFNQDQARLFISRENQITGDFLWTIPLIAVFQGYFEIFYAWSKVHMKTIGGNFLKEVFYRLSATVMLILVATQIITQVQFIYSLVLIYALRAFLMKIVAYRIYYPKWRWGKLLATKELITYSLFMIIAGSVGTAMLDLDKGMLNQFNEIENIAYYNVAIFIAAVIAVPARGMAQVLHPLVASYYAANNTTDLEKLYKRSSLNLSIVSGFLLLIIVCNVNEFYKLLEPEFSIAIPVVYLISLVKFSESLLGSNNAILYNTNLYRVTLWMGLCLVLVAVGLNIWLIPIYGLVGAAIATCVAYLSYSLAKVLYVYHRLYIHPWTPQTWKSLLIVIVGVLLFVFWDFSLNVYLNIALKSILITAYYILAILKGKVSYELTGLYQKYRIKKTA